MIWPLYLIRLCTHVHLYFVQPLNSLGTEDEEGQVEVILGRLKREVKQRRLLLYPYFRDYDRVRTYMSVWFGSTVSFKA